MSIDRIAKQAGVSKSTVSRVLNGRPGPSLGTIRKVNRIVEKLGYTPAPLDRRRGMRKSASRSLRYGQVALILVDQGYRQHPELFAEMITGVGNALADHGITLILANHPHRLPAIVQRGSVDGVLLTGSRPSHELMSQLPSVPSVWLTSYHNHRQNHVMLGNEGAGQLAAEYLLSRTQGPLAYLNFEPTYLALHRRNHAFQLTAQAAGREVIPLALPAAATVQLSTVEQTRHILRGVPRQILRPARRPAGLFCACDRITAILYPLLAEAGVRPMHELPIVSCGHEQTYLAGLVPPPVTIDLAQRIVGQRAVEHLLNRIRRADLGPCESLALGAELVLPATPTRASAS